MRILKIIFSIASISSLGIDESRLLIGGLAGNDGRSLLRRGVFAGRDEGPLLLCRRCDEPRLLPSSGVQTGSAVTLTGGRGGVALR